MFLWFIVMFRVVVCVCVVLVLMKVMVVVSVVVFSCFGDNGVGVMFN